MQALSGLLPFLTLISFLLIAGCQSTMTPELNQCAQQNYQCESNCSMQSTEATLTQQLCTQQCVDDYNACKVQAEALGKAQ